MENQNLYNDNTFNIQSITDIEDIDQIYLLANGTEDFKFRLGSDFFSYNKENQSLMHYADYKSLYEGTNSKLIYENGQAIDNDYADAIVNGLNKINLENFREFDLKNLEQFYVNKEDKGIAIDLRKGATNAKSVDKGLKTVVGKFDVLKSEEMKPVKDIIDTFTSLASLLFLINLKKNKDLTADENNKIIGLMMEEINKGHFNVEDFNDKVLNKVPGLSEVLKDYKENYCKDFNLQLNKDGEVINNSSNIILLEERLDKLNVLLLGEGVKPLLLENPKDTNKLNSIIPQENDTMKFIKDFIMKDNSLNYQNYTSNEIAAGAMLAGIKTDLKRDKFNSSDNLFPEFTDFCFKNNIDFVKIGSLSDNIIGKITGFTLVNTNEESQTTSKGLKQ